MSTRSIRWQGVGVALFAAVAMVIAYAVERATGVRSPTSDPLRLQVVLPGADNMAQRADVRTGGVKVGQVEAIEIRGDHAVAQIGIDDRSRRVYRNASVRLRYKTPAGEGYLELVPGGPPAPPLADGDVIPRAQVSETVQLDDVFSTLREEDGTKLQRLLDGLGDGLAGRGEDLNYLLGSTAALVQDGAPMFDVLAEQRRNVARLVDDFGRVSRAIGGRADALRLLARKAKVSAEAVASREDYVAALVAELPSTLDQARQTSGDLGGFASRAVPVVADLRLGLARLDPVITRLPRASASGRLAVAELRRFLPHARPLLARLGPFADSAAALVSPLRAFLREMNPLAGYLSEHAEDLAAFFSNTGAATDSYDATGATARLSLLVNRGSVDAYLQPEVQQAIDQLEQAGLVAPLTGELHSNPYPEPGTLGDPKPFRGKFPRLRREP